MMSSNVAAVAPGSGVSVPGMRASISTDRDLGLFLESDTFSEMWDFLIEMNASVKDTRVQDCPLSQCSPLVKRLVGVMKLLLGWIDDIPPLDQPRRFGNRAFRDWFDKLDANLKAIVEDIIPQDANDETTQQLAAYLGSSFGNRTRIDYGTGHEASFLIFLFCLFKIGVATKTDLMGLTLHVFTAYLDTTRKLQKLYVLEPAGSHGVWGLDDFSFLPFLLGSSQLHSNQTIPTNAIYNNDILQREKQDFLYLSAVATIHEFKTGSLEENSPMICDIGAVKEGWPKINKGMFKMYRAEVWGKRQVVQHIFFGTIFPFSSRPSGMTQQGLAGGSEPTSL